jgi:uncharacterized membrane protein YkvA (DUF1232 family)
MSGYSPPPAGGPPPGGPWPADGPPPDASEAGDAGDPFPREEFATLIRRLPAYARLSWALARHPHLSRARRALVLAGAAYVISPIDLIPGIIPVVGQLDDLLVALGVIRLALNGLKPEFRAEVLTAAGLSEEDLGTDVRTTAAIVAWLGRSSVRLGARVTRDAVEVGREAAVIGREAIETGRGMLDAGLKRFRR